MQREMTAGEAVEVYSILTIGDGLVSIIPSLLMSICAGLIVTRVASDEEDANLGMDLAKQVLGKPKAFMIASGFILLVGLIPGFPTVPFIIMWLVKVPASTSATTWRGGPFRRRLAPW